MHEYIQDILWMPFIRIQIDLYFGIQASSNQDISTMLNIWILVSIKDLFASNLGIDQNCEWLDNPWNLIIPYYSLYTLNIPCWNSNRLPLMLTATINNMTLSRYYSDRWMKVTFCQHDHLIRRIIEHHIHVVCFWQTYQVRRMTFNPYQLHYPFALL